MDHRMMISCEVPQVKLLILGANGHDTARLRMDVEARSIKEEIARAGARDALRVESAFAVRPEDLQNQLLEHRPHALHFAGHGAAQGGADEVLLHRGKRDFLPEGEGGGDAGEESPGGFLLFEDQRGAAVGVRPQALARLLEIVKADSELRCVVLNACFSVEQARAIAEHVDCVVGMKRAIDDGAAIAFSAGFYRALAQKKNVFMAFELGRNEIDLQRLPDADVPELLCRSGVDPKKTFVVSAEVPVTPKGLRLRERMRRAAPFVAALLGVSCAAAAFLPLARVPADPGQKHPIVVAGPWLASAESRGARRALCEALDDEGARREGEPRVTCLALPLLGASEESVRAKAQEAGASLLVLVDNEGTARIRPLGALGGDAIFDKGLPRVELSDAAARAGLAPILRSLAHVVELNGYGERLDPSRLRCTPVSAEAPRSITLLSLLTGMFVPGCKLSGADAKNLRGSCAFEPSDSEECQLSMLLVASTSPSGPDAAKLRRKVAEASYRFLSVALIQGGRLACRSDDQERAKEAARALWEMPSACLRLPASVLASCVLSQGGAAGAAAAAEKDPWLREAEAFAGGSEAMECEASQRGATLAERGFWRARGARWAEAAADFSKAYEMSPENHALGLSLVEVLIHEGQAPKALDELKRIKGALRGEEARFGKERSSPEEDARAHRTRRDSIHAALLSWIAARYKADASEGDMTNASAELLDAYRSGWPDQAPVFNDAPDKVLRPLSCPSGVDPCAYDVLARPKTSVSVDMLREALAAAGRVKDRPPLP